MLNLLELVNLKGKANANVIIDIDSIVPIEKSNKNINPVNILGLVGRIAKSKKKIPSLFDEKF